jgi:hypothetical protein
MYINETIQKHSKYKYTYYQNTHTLQTPHITKPIHTHTLQNKLKQPQYKIHTKLDSAAFDRLKHKMLARFISVSYGSHNKQQLFH